MASNSLRSMYKSRRKEENTTASRRKSRGLERKSNRDDEINKRRLLSDDMSPLMEDKHQEVEALPQQKTNVRQERLKQWREDRKRKMEEEKKKNAKKPTFKVTHLKYAEESELFKWDMGEKLKAKNLVMDKPAKPQAKTNARAPKPVVKPSSQQKVATTKPAPSEVKSKGAVVSPRATRSTRAAQAKAKAPVTKPAKANSQAAVPKPSTDKPTTASRPESRRRGNGGDLYTRLTASAAAKAKTNSEKPKEFLRAKSRVTRSMTQSQKPATRNSKQDAKTDLKVSKKQEKLPPQIEVLPEAEEDLVEDAVAAEEAEHEQLALPLDDPQVVTETEASNEVMPADGLGEDEPLVAPPVDAAAALDEDRSEEAAVTSEPENSGSSSDSRELHLSDSAVSTPKHSTPAVNRKSITKEKQMAENEEDEDAKSVNRRRSGKTRKSRGGKRRSSRNMSVINPADVAMASKEMFRSLKECEEEIQPPTPSVLQNVVEEKEEANKTGAGLEEESKDELDNTKIPAAETELVVAIPSGRKSARKSVSHTGLNSSLRRSGRGDVNEEAETASLLDTSNKENFDKRTVDLRREVLSSSSARRSRRLDTSLQQDPGAAETMNAPNEIILVNENQPVAVRNDIFKPASSQKKRTRRSIFPVEDDEAVIASPSKRPRRSILKSGAADIEPTHSSGQSSDDVSSSALAVTNEPTPVSHQRDRMGSAISKRRSVRIAALASTGEEDTTESETEDHKKRRSSRRRDTPRRPRSYTAPKSTVVSVSDEGTSDVIGDNDNVVDEVQPQATPKHEQRSRKFSQSSSKSRSVRRSARRSEVIDVSDEGTASATDVEPDVVYQVMKPETSEPSSRALQELTVEKVDGEISYIEVPMDESVDQGVCSKDSPAKSSSTSSASSDQSPRRVVSSTSSATGDQSPHRGVSATSSATGDQSPHHVVSEDNNHTTQPFSPRRSCDVTKSVTSSTQSSPTVRTSPAPSPAVSFVENLPSATTPAGGNVTASVCTPRSSRRRGRSMAPSPSFKTPGQPLSAVRPRSTRRRKTEHSGPSKSPEEMIEILKRSPMVEMSRRRSRHVSTPSTAFSGQTHFEDLFTATPSRQQSNTSAPAVMETTQANTSAPELMETQQQDKLEPEVMETQEANTLALESVGTQHQNTSAPEVMETQQTVMEAHEPNTLATQVTESVSSNTEDVNMLDTEAVVAAPPQHPQSPHLGAQVAERVRYFRDLLVTETYRLNQQCDKWNEISSSSSGLGEDVLGQIRSTVGKAQLLIDQRFKQFSGLVDNCEFSLGEKETTPTDLQGFWDMIYFQVEDVDQLFIKLREWQQNDWQIKQPSPEKVAPKPKSKKMAVKVSKPKVKSNFASFREALLQKKKAKATAENAPSDVAQDSETTKVFDAGFFRVTSPIRSTSAGRKSTSGTPLRPSPEKNQTANQERSSPVPQVNEKPAGETSKPSTPAPVVPSNKENQILNTPNNSRLMSMTAKRLSYVPVVPSPLLNDITGLTPKKY